MVGTVQNNRIYPQQNSNTATSNNTLPYNLRRYTALNNTTNTSNSIATNSTKSNRSCGVVGGTSMSCSSGSSLYSSSSSCSSSVCSSQATTPSPSPLTTASFDNLTNPPFNKNSPMIIQLKFDEINDNLQLMSPNCNDLTLVGTCENDIITHKKATSFTKTPANTRVLPSKSTSLSNSARPPLPTPKNQANIKNDTLSKTSVITRSKLKRQQGLEINNTKNNINSNNKNTPTLGSTTKPPSSPLIRNSAFTALNKNASNHKKTLSTTSKAVPSTNPTTQARNMLKESGIESIKSFSMKNASIWKSTNSTQTTVVAKTISINNNNINNNQTKTSIVSSEVSEYEEELLLLTKAANNNKKTDLQNSVKKKKKSKKRVTLTLNQNNNDEMNYEEEEEESSEESNGEDNANEKTILKNKHQTKHVKFQLSSNATTTSNVSKSSNYSNLKASRTPPHKKFRKLRLFDVPHTPKTLLKKSECIISSKSESLANSPSKTNVTREQAVMMDSEEFSSPSNSQQARLFTDILDNVNQTPKSVRRTPASSGLTRPALLDQSPQFIKNSDSEMDTDQNCREAEMPNYNKIYNSINKSLKNSATRVKKFSIQTSTQRSLRMRLFEEQSETAHAANKILNFDDADEDSAQTTDSESVLTFNNIKKNKMSDDEFIIHRNHASMPCSSRGTPLSFQKSTTNNNNNKTNSKCDFKPIRRLRHGFGSVGTGLNQNHRTNSITSICSLDTGLMNHYQQQQQQQMIKSPHSPFTCAFPANINPFTPTNVFADNSSSKLSSASNAANMVRLAAANLKHETAMLISTSIANKRNYEDTKSVDHDQIMHDESSALNTSQTNSVSSTSTCTTAHYNDETQLPKNKRLALRQCLVSRYHEEFHEVCKLGSGEFGDVFKCINRLDGCTYAIKRSKKPIAGSALETSAWKEVCAHAVLVKHNHIVQYYSAWAEADRMLIQNEYCNGGSLAEFIDSLKMNENVAEPQHRLLMTEYDLKTLLLHMAKGLGYMHAQNLVHLDIKPGNIFICRAPRRQLHALSEASSKIGAPNAIILNEESGIESEEIDEDDMSKLSLNSIFSEIITYKIGDLGHVTSTLDPHVEEGDCRYLPNEILQEQYENLTKADVFALALTVFVAGSLEELPKNGDEWHWIRRGNLKNLAQCSDKFNKLLLQMVDESPVQRPSCSTLIHHQSICPDANKSKAQLRKELNREKFKNEMLQRKVKLYEEQMSKFDSPINSQTTTIITAAKISTVLTNSKTSSNSSSSSKFARSFSSSLI